jgi:hypothetical protein
MELSCSSIYNHLLKIIRNNTIDLSECTFIHPWALILICLLLVKKHNNNDKEIILPKSSEALFYLRRARLHEILKKLSYNQSADFLEKIFVNEKDNLNIQEIIHCNFRDEFNARLERFGKIFMNFGLRENDARLVVALIGELGNNVYDHNLGNWPTDISGCFITAQNYPQKKCLEFVIGDPGIGFLGSLKANFPGLSDDISAIKHGLAGNTGRINEDRGNGLKFIQNWTLENFSGNILIHSGKGLVFLDKDKIEGKEAVEIVGTIVQIMLYYK